MERRGFMRLAGGGVVMAATGGLLGGALGGCSLAEVPASAVAAWQGPPRDAELRHWVLAHALLAPNPHNLQPWLADLGTPDEIILRLDGQRLLPATDPYGRQILMGAGAFLELLVMAAAEQGQRADLTLFPQGEPGLHLDGHAFARVRLQADATVARDPLFAQVFARRTDRRAYDPDRAPAAADVQRLHQVAGALPVRFGIAGAADTLAADGARLAEIRRIVREAWRLELTTEAPLMESMRLMRVGSAEIDRYRDGITVDSLPMVALVKSGLFDRSKPAAPDSQAILRQIADFNALTAATPAYLWIVTEGKGRAPQIDAGRAYLRINLAGCSVGLAMHPNEQSLQEYAEMALPYQAIHAGLDAPGPRYTVQMLARLGYLPAGAQALGPAPRRGLPGLLAA